MAMRYWIEVMRKRVGEGITGLEAEPVGVRIALIDNGQITADVSEAIEWANRAAGLDGWDYLNLVSDFKLPDGNLVRGFQSQRIKNPGRLS